DVVINAAGPWANQVMGLVGGHVPIETSVHCVVTMRAPTLQRHTPVCSDPFNLIYTRPEGGQLLIGSTDPRDTKHVIEPDRHEGAAGATDAFDLVERACRRFPALLEGELVASWSGLYDCTPDAYPIIDRVAETEGMYIAAGLSGHGFKLAPSI